MKNINAPKKRNFKDKKSIQWLLECLFNQEKMDSFNEKEFPSLETFKEMDLREYGIFTEKNVEVTNLDVALIHSNGTLKFDKSDKMYKVVLMYNSTAKIIATNYAVVMIEGEGATLYTDETVKIL